MTPKDKIIAREEIHPPSYQPVSGPQGPCPPDRHGNHLCELLRQGILQKDPGQYRSRVEQADFVCERCGGSAAAAESLCWPIPLEPPDAQAPQSLWKRFAHNLRCLVQNHPNHLCYLMYKGFHEKNPVPYKTLVEHPKFICQTCFRTAAQKENLCNPAPLP